ncbi:hypothetical protein TeGR_g2476, partial [Tetraparma gracilis]
MKLFKTIKAVASGACRIAAAVADTALFAGVPVVSTVLNVASSISGKIEERQETDETLETVHSMLSGIAPVIAQVGEAAECGGTPPALVGALQAMAATMKEVQKQVDSYTNTWTGLKYAVAKEAEEDLRACLEELDRQLNLVSTAISGQTYVEVLRSQGMLEELKLGVFGTERHLDKIRGEMATSEQMDAVSRQMTSAREELGRGQAGMNGKLDDLSRSEQQKLEDELAVLELQTKLVRQRMNSGTPTLNKNSSSAETETVDEKWERLRDDAGAEGKSIPADYTLVMAVEGIFLDGDDACNKKVLLSLMDIGNTGVVTKGEFKKFCSRWKKTGLDFAAYLEQETEKKGGGGEAARKAQEEAAEAKRVADEKRRQAEAAAEK